MNRPYGEINPMPKSLRTFLDDMRRAYPSEVVSIAKTVNPLSYDVTAIVKQLGALKKFPILIFEQPLNAHGHANDMKLVMSAENSQKKIQVALGIPAETDRAEMARECLRREAAKIGPVIVSKDSAPVKEIIQTGDRVDLYELPLLRHHEMDGGPYIDMSSVAQGPKQRCLQLLVSPDGNQRSKPHRLPDDACSICGGSFAATKKPMKNVRSPR